MCTNQTTCEKSDKPSIRVLYTLMLFFLVAAISNAEPAITHVNSVEVDGSTISVTSAEIQFEGTSGAGTSIRLYSEFGLAATTSTLGNGTWSISSTNIMDGSHSFYVAVEDWPRVSTISNRVSVNVDTSGSAEDPAYTFLINRRSDGRPETTTRSSSVKITLFTNDPDGITSASISNDGITWTTWAAPATAPNTHYWSLADSPGIATLYMKFYDADANESAIITRQIGYYKQAAQHTGSAADQTYPTSTYDEYPGENKYGSPRTDASQPETGSSVKITTP